MTVTFNFKIPLKVQTVKIDQCNGAFIIIESALTHIDNADTIRKFLRSKNISNFVFFETNVFIQAFAFEILHRNLTELGHFLFYLIILLG